MHDAVKHEKRFLRLTAWALLCGVFVGAPAARGALSENEMADLYSQAGDLFRRANAAAAKDAGEARRLYEKSVLRLERIVNEGGVHNGRLYYNIGNTYFRMRRLGRAILNYRRAELYIPQDPNLQQNLQFARERRRDVIEERQQTRVLKTLFFWHYDTSRSARARALAVAFAVFWLLAAARLFVRRASLTALASVAGAVALLAAVSLGVESAQRQARRAGVIVAEETVARKGDSRAYEPSFKDPLHEGTEFVLVEQRPEWCHVELADGRRCWLREGTFEWVW
jgi:tetratricopeptide (TPR) repeat protein